MSNPTPKEIHAGLRALTLAEKKLDADIALWPKPELYATPTKVLNRSASKFARLCEEWRATRARGPAGQQARPGWRMADSLVLRGKVGHRYFVAMWVEGLHPNASGGKTFVLQHAYAHGLQGRISAAQLEAYLTQDDDPSLPWLEGVPFIPRDH